MNDSDHQTLEPVLTRRSFLVLAGAFGLAACSNGTTPNEPEVTSSSRIRMLNWPDYIGQETLDAFQVASAGDVDEFVYEPIYGESVEYDDVKQALEEGTINYDIITLPNWQAAQIIGQGLVAELPIEFIPNHKNLDPAFMANSWDRGARFQMPWQSGITGIAYNKAKLGPISSLASLFDSANRGRVGFITEMREALGLSMLLDGADPSRPTAAGARAGMARISTAVADGQIGFFGDTDMIDALEGEVVDIAMAWSGDATALGADFDFIVPTEGAMQWFDTMMIPNGASAAKQAAEFMNFIYDPVNAAVLTQEIQYISPVVGVDTVLESQGSEVAVLVDDPLEFPSAQARSRL